MSNNCLSSDDHSDFELYQRWMAGDRDAGSVLVKRHHAALLTWLHARVGSLCSSQDIAHEVWLRAMRGGYRGRGSFCGWLIRIARTRLNRHRRSQRRSSLEVRDWTSPSRQVLRGEAMAALDELSPPQREALQLYILNWPLKKIASATQTTPSTAHSRVRLALEKLRERFA